MSIDKLRALAEDWRKQANTMEWDKSNTELRFECAKLSFMQCAEELNSYCENADDDFAEERQAFNKVIEKLNDEINLIVVALQECKSKFLNGVEGTPCSIAARIIRESYYVEDENIGLDMTNLQAKVGGMENKIDKLDRKIRELDEVLLMHLKQDLNMELAFKDIRRVVKDLENRILSIERGQMVRGDFRLGGGADQVR